LIPIVRVFRRIVTIALDDIFTWFANPDVGCLTEHLTRQDGRALGIENLTARPTMVLAPEG
jgi:hypothetical protein